MSSVEVRIRVRVAGKPGDVANDEVAIYVNAESSTRALEIVEERLQRLLGDPEGHP